MTQKPLPYVLESMLELRFEFDFQGMKVYVADNQFAVKLHLTLFINSRNTPEGALSSSQLCRRRFTG